jgi:Cysteine-rich CWC
MCKHETRKCPRCNTEFECKAGTIAQCQCYGIALTVEQRAYVEQRYSGCLCRTCLDHLSVELNLFKDKYIFR